MLKSTAGGGGIGMQLVPSTPTRLDADVRARRAPGAQQLQGCAASISRSIVARGRHIEVQIFGDGEGSVVALGERDCSAQRRNQKVIEETPAPDLPETTRAALCARRRVALGQAVELRIAPARSSSSTTPSASEFYFLEVNTRLQVEHGVTEEVTGIDLVEWMMRAGGGRVAAARSSTISSRRGASIQVRALRRGSRPRFPAQLRAADRSFAGRRMRASRPGWRAARRCRPIYDPMLAKIIVTARRARRRCRRLQTALDASAHRRASKPISTICVS